LRLVFAVLWFLVLAVAMLTPGTKLPDVDLFDFQDKAVHLLCFLIQGYLWSGIGVNKNQVSVKNPTIWKNFVFFGILPGIGLESLQQIIPNRSFELMDMIVNAFGASLGFLLYFKWPFIKFILD
jgi:VanZ family protein